MHARKRMSTSSNTFRTWRVLVGPFAACQRAPTATNEHERRAAHGSRSSGQGRAPMQPTSHARARCGLQGTRFQRPASLGRGRVLTAPRPGSHEASSATGVSRRPSSQQPKRGQGRNEHGNNPGPVWRAATAPVSGARHVRLGAVGVAMARRRPRRAPWARWGPPGAWQALRAGGSLGAGGSRLEYRRQKMDSGLKGSPLSPSEGSKGTKSDGRAWTRPDRWAPHFQRENGGGPLIPREGGSAVSGFDSRRFQ
ncbi:hypothetical protein CYFUS_002690 [Cystobacter fuscus]|uniref:Uncharacterized protein n=1 Tax=Cystobacter fuscus TaxID=43 RepID=A0A250IZX4_9BACT|nr:hypothetical protein CYFUS_002690 [Cystobacter fuscus]